ncbi:hypothetical protein ECTW15901_4084 [Escherichia coli TW15901]|nr:hypothetical protein ECTW15901_4084 [Escherichia coli TW15901]
MVRFVPFSGCITPVFSSTGLFPLIVAASGNTLPEGLKFAASINFSPLSNLDICLVINNQIIPWATIILFK